MCTPRGLLSSTQTEKANSVLRCLHRGRDHLCFICREQICIITSSSSSCCTAISHMRSELLSVRKDLSTLRADGHSGTKHKHLIFSCDAKILVKITFKARKKQHPRGCLFLKTPGVKRESPVTIYVAKKHVEAKLLEEVSTCSVATHFKIFSSNLK